MCAPFQPFVEGALPEHQNRTHQTERAAFLLGEYEIVSVHRADAGNHSIATQDDHP